MTSPLLSNPEIHELHQQVQSLKSQLILEEQKLPSQKLFDVNLLQVDINTLEGKLAAHNEAKAVEAEAKAKALAVSMKILEDTLKSLEKTADMLDKNWVKLHHMHRGRVADIKNSLRQLLR